MSMFNDTIEDIMRHEGFRSKPYRDSVGKWTVGYGWNLEDRPMSPALGKTILTQMVIEAEDDCMRIVQGFYEHPDECQSVLINMCYNLGPTRFARFGKMLNALKAKDYKKAADEMRASLWYNQVGERASELAHRMEMVLPNEADSNEDRGGGAHS